MRFELRKLALGEATSLRQIDLSKVEPYVPLPAPVYLLMKRNQKFVSLKRPLDFFTPRELSSLEHGAQVYYTDLLDRVIPFQEGARRVRGVLNWRSPSQDGLEPAGYEISQEVLKIMATLWAPLDTEHPEILGIETHFIVAFTNELCEPLPSGWIQRARDEDVDSYETALLRAGMVVFLALHIGINELPMLNLIRTRVFLEGVRLEEPNKVIPCSRELEELKTWSEKVILDSNVKIVTDQAFQRVKNRASQKVFHRLSLIRKELIRPGMARHSALGTVGVSADDIDLMELAEQKREVRS